MSSPDSQPIVPATAPKRRKSNCPPGVVKGIQNIADAVGIRDIHFPDAFLELEKSTRAKRVNTACRITDVVMSAFAPDAPNQLKAMVLKKSQGRTWKRDHCESFIASLENVAEQYLSATSRQMRLDTLAGVAPVLSYLELQEYIPGLTQYMWKEARLYAKMTKTGLLPPTPQTTRLRYKRKAVNAFVEFITSSFVVSDLPFGYATVRRSDGTKEEIPNLLRNSVNTRIIRQYQEFLRLNHPAITEGSVDPQYQISESTMWKILDGCKASTRRSMMGLDYITYEGEYEKMHHLKTICMDDFALQVLRALRPYWD